MIFRKPYAFLIKYFRIINIILAVLTTYILYRTYNIVKFFNDYVTNNYMGNFYKGFSNVYISPILYILIIIIIIGISLIILLFINRKKPIKVYAFSIIYYLILVVFFSVTKNTMVTLELTTITAEIARIYRDLSLLMIVPELIFILSFLLRGFGLNIKKFNFENDLKDLQVSAVDSEEVELAFNNDGVKVRRNLRRFGREFIYYIKENKFIFIVILLISIILIVSLIYHAFPEIIDQNYKQKDMFISNDLKYIIDDSILTNLDYKGDLFDNNNYYIVLKLNITNDNNKDVEIDYKDFRLEVNDNSIYPNLDKSVSFIDYASICPKGLIKANSNIICEIPFEISKDNIKNSYKVKNQNGYVYINNEKKAKYNYITITPVLIDKINIEASYNKGDLINFKNSNLGNTTLVLTNPLITNKYLYNYEFCSNSNCSTYKNIINVDYLEKDKTLLILDYVYKPDEIKTTQNHFDNIHTMIDSYMKIKYVENDQEYYSYVKNVTPNNLNNKIVLEVTNMIKETEEVYISFIIRNKEYLVKIK